MGKSKPTKWFKAVKKAFRSPSKERQAESPEHHETNAGDLDEKLLAKHDLSSAPYQAPTPHPLPSYEIITHEEVNEPDHMSRGQPLPTPEDVAPAAVIPGNLPDPENHVIKEEEPKVQVVEKPHQDDDVESTLSEDDEAAAMIQQRFSEPMALKGLIRVQALVRGHRVRRQAATTLQTIEAIVRVQAVFRGRRVRVSKDGRAVRSRISKRRRLSSRAGAQYGDLNVSRGPAFQESEHSTLDEEDANRGKRRPTTYLLTQQLKRSAPNRSSLFIDCGPGQPHWGWAWLELWSNARPWEIRTPEELKKGAKRSTKESSSSKGQSRDYIEIIPGPRKSTSEYATKEIDINTLKVKCYEDYVPTPGAVSRSSNPSSAVKAEKKDPPGVRSSTEKNSVKSSPGVKSSTEKREPAIKSPRSVMPEKKDPVSVRSSSSPFSEKKEPVSVRSSPSPLSHDKKEPFSRSQKKEPASRSSTSKPELSVNVPPSSPGLSDQKKELGVTSPGLSEKKEQGVIPPSSPETKGLGVIPPSSPGSSEVEQHGASPPDSPSHIHRTMPRPPPIEVPAHPDVVEERAVDPGPIDHLKSPAPEKTSPAVSEAASIGVSPSPQASEASLPVPETPPGAVDSPSVTMEHSGNGGERTESLKNGDSHSSGFSGNGDHLPGDETPSVKDSDNVVNGHMRHRENGDSSKARNGDSAKVANGDANNGESPGIVPSKKPTPRYMLLTESAMTKQKESRSSSNPKTRAPDTPESPARTPKRYSIGGTPLVTTKGTEHSPKTAFGTRKSTSFQSRGTPSPKAANPSPKAANPSPKTANPSPKTANPSPKAARPSPKAVAPAEEIKPTREMETGTASPARRNSGGGDGKRWRT